MQSVSNEQTNKLPEGIFPSDFLSFFLSFVSFFIIMFDCVIHSSDVELWIEWFFDHARSSTCNRCIRPV